jgi:hypothetical protein
MGNVNRKATADEMAYAARVIREAFPEYDPVFGGHGAYNGHRAPRDHTISFRLRDRLGKYHSNVIWIPPDYIQWMTVEDIRALVARKNGAKPKKKRKKRR